MRNAIGYTDQFRDSILLSVLWTPNTWPFMAHCPLEGGHHLGPELRRLLSWGLWFFFFFFSYSFFFLMRIDCFSLWRLWNHEGHEVFNKSLVSWIMLQAQEADRFWAGMLRISLSPWIALCGGKTGSFRTGTVPRQLSGCSWRAQP